MSDIIKCNICGGLHEWRVAKNAQRPVGPWEDYCPIYSYFDYIDGWKVFRHVDLYSDEKLQADQINSAWERWIYQKRKADYRPVEYDVVCTCCGRNYISDNSMRGECISCSMRGAEL